MIDLEHDLTRLGDRLTVDDDGLVDDVLARVVAPSPGRAARPPQWLVAAAILVIVIAGALALPASRRVVADWFGLDGVTIEQQPDLTAPAASDDLPAGIVVDSFDGAFENGLITKVLGGGTGIERIDVGGRPGLWIDGDPHEVLLLGADGAPTTRRFAGNTLLWQDGDTIHRVEGAASLAEALTVARDV